MINIRQCIIDYLLTDQEITSIISDRMTDIFYTSEDFANAGPNGFVFPAVFVGINSDLEDNAVNVRNTNFFNSSLTLTLLQPVTVERFRSRNSVVRNRERLILREIDDLAIKIKKAIDIIPFIFNNCIFRKAQIISMNDYEFSSNENQIIIGKDVEIEIIYSEKE